MIHSDFIRFTFIEQIYSFVYKCDDISILSWNNNFVQSVSVGKSIQAYESHLFRTKNRIQFCLILWLDSVEHHIWAYKHCIACGYGFYLFLALFASYMHVIVFAKSNGKRKKKFPFLLNWSEFQNCCLAILFSIS